MGNMSSHISLKHRNGAGGDYNQSTRNTWNTPTESSVSQPTITTFFGLKA